MRKTLIILLSFFSLSTFAENVTEQRAKELAVQFLQSVKGSRTSSISLKMVYNGKQSETRTSYKNPPLFVFNNTLGKGFVIIAGNDAATPILGYATDANFKSENMPMNIRRWLEGYEEQIRYLQQNHIAASPDAARDWNELGQTKRSREGGGVLLKTALWSQEYPYNMKCFKINGKNALTGCTNTALAIVMNYHQWPDKGTGTLPSYTFTSDEDGKEYTVPAQELGHPYLWKNMVESYNDTSTDAQNDAVATLMRDCGIMTQSSYGIWGTGSFIGNIVEGLVKYMKYDASCEYINKKHFVRSKWNEMLKNELDNNRPIVYAGFTNMMEGHAFVFDGYNEEGEYHVNWGWEGSCNGYYPFTALYPSENGHRWGDFTKLHEAIIGIEPDRNNDSLSKEISFDYNKSTRTIILNKAEDIDVEVTNDKGQDISSLCRIDSNSCMIDVSKLSAATVFLYFTFSRGGDSTSIQIKLPQK